MRVVWGLEAWLVGRILSLHLCMQSFAAVALLDMLCVRTTVSEGSCGHPQKLALNGLGAPQEI